MVEQKENGQVLYVMHKIKLANNEVLIQSPKPNPIKPNKLAWAGLKEQVLR